MDVVFNASRREREKNMTQQTLTFESFGLAEGIIQALQEADFKIPSPIQQEVIPHILAGRDLIGQAQTGTGKTGAFGLPALHLLQQSPGAQMLVMTPTRELAKQVSDELYRFSRHLGIKTATICGGKAFKGQIESLQNGVQVLVATPGRLLDLLQSHELPNFRPTIVVLDEADEMLDMGFLEDIKQIFDFLPKKRQTLLFSATMPIAIKHLAEKILHHPLFISATRKETVNQDIEQFYYMIREEDRDYALIRLIDNEDPEKAIIFCRTKKDVDRLTHFLVTAGYVARGLHGDMEQPQREEVIRNFRTEHLRFLVATDVAARGLNVANISHVFNYHLPFDPNNYLHRIGRTGRAGNKGVASTFLTSREWRDFQRFEKVLGTRIHQREIPTLKEVKNTKRRQLAQQIMTQSIHEETDHLLQLMQEADPATVASKLISLLLSQQVVMGPERIGIERRPSDKPKQVSDNPVKQRRGQHPKPVKNFKSSKPSKPHGNVFKAKKKRTST
jgi:ATP-dependent RNA helicase DeaD